MVWAVAAAGFFGAVARYLLDGFVQNRFEGVLPLGTLVVNVSGSLLAGCLAGLVIYHDLPGGVRTVAGVGFLGAYTTFSTYALETVRLLEDEAVFEALLNLAGSLAAGLGGAALGLALVGAL